MVSNKVIAIDGSASARHEQVGVTDRSIPSTDLVESFFAGAAQSLTPIESKQMFYGNSPSELKDVSRWLLEASDNSILRITGGSLFSDPTLAERVKRELLHALSGFDGIGLSGSTETHFARSPGISRPGMHEVGALLSARNPDARIIGAFPGNRIDYDSEGKVLVSVDEYQGQIALIRPHHLQERFILAGKPTGYFWDPEWQTFLNITQKLLHSQEARLAVNVSFDGGEGTMNELKAWAKASEYKGNMHLLLIRGGSAARATDTLASDLEWLRNHPNVHIVGIDRGQIVQKLDQIGLFESATISCMA